MLTFNEYVQYPDCEREVYYTVTVSEGDDEGDPFLFELLEEGS